MRDFLTTEEFEGFLKGNVIKYLYRAGDKRDKQEDLRKAADYACMLAFDCWTSDICHANKAEMMEADAVAASETHYTFGCDN